MGKTRDGAGQAPLCQAKRATASRGGLFAPGATWEGLEERGHPPLASARRVTLFVCFPPHPTPALGTSGVHVWRTNANTVPALERYSLILFVAEGILWAVCLPFSQREEGTIVSGVIDGLTETLSNGLI